MSVSVRIAIAHAGFLPERRAGLDRMLGELAGEARVFTSDRKEHASVWATRVWRWVAEQPDGTPVAVLNDDVFCHPRLMAVLRAMHAAAPGRMLSLHPQHPEAERLAREGHNWFRCYWVTGPAYLLYPEQARSLLAYAAEERNRRLWEGNEDNVAIHWCYERQEPPLTCLPAVVRHDDAVASTLGYDAHPNRVARVLWEGCERDLTRPEAWALPARVPFIENSWATTAQLDAHRHGAQPCSFCLAAPPVATARRTGAKICAQCLAEITKTVLLAARPR